MHSATLCSSPNKDPKERLPETSPAVLTDARCWEVRPLIALWTSSPAVEQVGRQSLKDEGGAADQPERTETVPVGL